MKKIKIDTSLFKKVNSQFNEKLVDTISDINMNILEKLHKKIVDDYVLCLSKKISHERIKGQIDTFIEYGKAIYIFNDSVDFNEIEEKILEKAYEQMETAEHSV